VHLDHRPQRLVHTGSNEPPATNYQPLLLSAMREKQRAATGPGTPIGHTVTSRRLVANCSSSHSHGTSDPRSTTHHWQLAARQQAARQQPGDLVRASGLPARNSSVFCAKSALLRGHGTNPRQSALRVRSSQTRHLAGLNRPQCPIFQRRADFQHWLQYKFSTSAVSPCLEHA
jgi:hypothetical protein